MNLPTPEEFNFKDCVIGGDECVFISGKNITTKWTEDTLKFRSIILRKSDHFVVNSSYKKFFNFAEQPDLEPFPKDNFTAVGKMDGSTLILGCHNGEVIARTRGTLSVRQLDNGHEIDLLEKKYPKLWDLVRQSEHHSVLLEWETPNNYIVLRRVEEPTLTLTGIINNRTLEYLPQYDLDFMAQLANVERPKTYNYSSIQECISDVETWRGLEGVVVYSECGQRFRKIKAKEYCELHSLMSGMKTIDNVLDVFIASPRFLNSEEFHKYISDTLDFEVAERCKDHIERICDAYCNAWYRVCQIGGDVNCIRRMETRRDQAQYIQKHCKGWETSLAFIFLDNKIIDDKVWRKAIEHYLNEN